MSGIDGVGGAMGIDRVMALRSQILERNQALARANASAGAAAPVATTQPTSFADTLGDALKGVNDSQNAAARVSEAYERGDTIDIAKVMLARQEASVGFEATLQVRNKLLSAYKDIMSMPV
ncbi:flagellar hook-basal body complex protein FliE [uncultured Sphingomonas sp.]|uniref:flagellar hook-basal body complex protein FliE n=1 Tax=uncultured Sphingomonas sp. TaxID=158754 RepID=UPI0035CC6693